MIHRKGKAPGKNLGLVPPVVTEILRDFLNAVQKITGGVPKIKLWPLFSASFQILSMIFSIIRLYFRLIWIKDSVLKSTWKEFYICIYIFIFADVYWITSTIFVVSWFKFHEQTRYCNLDSNYRVNTNPVLNVIWLTRFYKFVPLFLLILIVPGLISFFTTTQIYGIPYLIFSERTSKFEII